MNVETLIQFVSAGGGGGGGDVPIVNPTSWGAQTGDAFGIVIAALLAVTCVAFFAVRIFARSKVYESAEAQTTASSKTKTASIVLGAIIAILACSVIVNVTNTQAAASRNASNASITAPDKIKAVFDEQAGTIALEKSYLMNPDTTDVVINSITVKNAEGIDDGGCTWTIDAFDTTLYSDKAGNTVTFKDPKTLATGEKTDVQISTNMGIATAKTLIDKGVLTMSFAYSDAPVPPPPPPTEKVKVNGIAVDANGNPIAGASVNIYDKAGNVIATTQTNADGSYTLEIPDEYIPLSVGIIKVSTGTGIGQDIVVKNLTDDVTLSEKSVVEPSTKVSGMVTDDQGNPIAGAEVTYSVLVEDPDGTTHIETFTTVTDDNGNYTLDVKQNHEYTANIDKNSNPEVHTSTEVKVEETPVQEDIIISETMFAVTVNLAGGSVKSVPQGWTSASAGTYTREMNKLTKLNSIVATWENAEIQAPDGMKYTHFECSEAGDTLVANTTFTANYEWEAVITGTALDDDGNVLTHGKAVFKYDDGTTAEVNIKEDGTFILPVKPNSSGTFHTESDNKISDDKKVTTAPGETDLGDIYNEEATTISGTVKGPDGQPLPNTEVEISTYVQRGDDLVKETYYVKTDEKGNYEKKVQQNKDYKIEIEVPGTDPVVKIIEEVKVEDTPVVVPPIIVPDPTQTAVATINLQGGKALKTVEGWTKAADNTYTKTFAKGSSYEAITSDWNYVEITPPVEGQTFEGWDPASGTLTANTTFKAIWKSPIPPTPKHKITGTTVNEYSKVEPNVNVTFTTNDGKTFTTTSKSDGSFELGPFDEGTEGKLSFHSSSPSKIADEKEVTIGEEDVDTGKSMLEPSVTITIKVKDTSGKPIPNADVNMEDNIFIDGEKYTENYNGKSNDKGEVTIEVKKNKNYTTEISFGTSPIKDYVTTIEVTGEDKTPIDVTIDTASTMQTIKVYLEKGSIAPEDVPTGWTKTGEAATQTYKKDLLSDVHTIQTVIDIWTNSNLIPPQGQLLSIFIEEEKNELHAKYINAASIKGEILNSDGLPAPGTTVQLFNDEGKLIDQQVTNENGDYEFDVPEGFNGTVKPSTPDKIASDIPVEDVTGEKTLEPGTLQTKVKLSGLVTDPSDIGLQNVQIVINGKTQIQGKLADNKFSASTNKFGSYSVEVAANAEYKLTMTNEKGEIFETLFKVTTADATLNHKFNGQDFILKATDISVDSEHPDGWTWNNDGYFKTFAAGSSVTAIMKSWEGMKVVYTEEIEGIVFSGWKYSTETLTQDATATATWKIPTTFKPNDSGLGNVTLNPTTFDNLVPLNSSYTYNSANNVVTITSEGTQVVTATPSPTSSDYTFENWKVNGGEIQPTGTISEKSEFVANFNIPPGKVAKAIFIESTKTMYFVYDEVDYTATLGVNDSQYILTQDTKIDLDTLNSTFAPWQEAIAEYPALPKSLVSPLHIVFEGSFKEFTSYTDPSYNAAKPFTSMSGWFMNMDEIRDFNGFENIYDGILDASFAFANLKSLSEFNTEKIKNELYEVSKIEGQIDLTNFNQTKLQKVVGMFLSSHYAEITIPGGFAPEATEFGKIYSGTGYSVKAGLLFGAQASRIEIQGSIGAKVTNFSGAFGGLLNVGSLASIGIANVDFSKAKIMDYAFCFSFQESFTIPDSLKEAELTSLEGMFMANLPLQSIDLNGLNTENVTNTSYMFAYCYFLEVANMNSLGLSKVTKANNMFDNTDITETNVTSSLKTINIWGSIGSASSPLQDTTGMFINNPKLERIYSLEWTFASNATSTDMFKNCPLLIGGNGFKNKDNLPQDSTYAKVDYHNHQGFFTCNTSEASRLGYDLGSVASFEGNPDYENYYQQIYDDKSFTVQGATALPGPVSTDGSGRVFDYWYLEESPGTHYTSGEPLPGGNDTYLLKAAWKNPLTPKAVYDDGTSTGADPTLTFYYDDVTHTGTKVFDVPTESPTAESPFVEVASSTKKVIFDSSFKSFTDIKNLNYWFMNFTNLAYVEGEENIETSQITGMVQAFNNTDIQEIDFSQNNFSNVTSIKGLFCLCDKLISAKFPEGNDYTSVVDIQEAFYNNYLLEFVDFGSLKITMAGQNTPFVSCDALYRIKTKATWSKALYQFLGEQGAYSIWKSEKTGVEYVSTTIYGNAEGDTYTRVLPVPIYENLYEYSAEELKKVSDYLGDVKTGNVDYDFVYNHFNKYLENGLTKDGSDNGTPMKNDDGTFKPFAKNHWAIDSQGRIATDEGFENNAITTIQARIIGICEDVGEDDKPIGLTMMTTHTVLTSEYNYDTALYGWDGDEKNGSCLLRTNLNNEGLYPDSLINAVKSAKKGFRYSNSATPPMGEGTAYDKFWAPSMVELYNWKTGDSWPQTGEGNQYSAFSNMSISSSQNYGSFLKLNYTQNDVQVRWPYIYSRSIFNGSSQGAGVIHCDDAGAPFSVELSTKEPSTACFCFGTEPEKTAKGVLYQDASENDDKFEFVYDAKTYTPGVDGVKNVYTINYNTFIDFATMEHKFPDWIEAASGPAPVPIPKISPTSVVFEESFKDFHSFETDNETQEFTSLALWFAGMKSINSINGFEYLPQDQILDMSLFMGGFSAHVDDSTSAYSSYNEDEFVVDLHELKQNKLDNIIGMFASCLATKIILPPNFAEKATKVTAQFVIGNSHITISAFTGCFKLTTLEVANSSNGSYTVLSNANDVTALFWRTPALVNIDFEKFNLSKVTKAERLFSNSSGLSTVTFPDTFASNGDIINSSRMFELCTSLERIYTNRSFSFTTTATYDDMFTQCSLLLGGNGTIFDANKVDGAMAKIDKAGQISAGDVAGYLTYKGADACKLTYNLNGGTAQGDAYNGYFQQVKQGDWFNVQGAIPLPDPELTGEGTRNFAGWKLADSEDQTIYTKENRLQAPSDNTSIELVAQWEETPAGTAKAVCYENDGVDTLMEFVYDDEEYVVGSYSDEKQANIKAVYPVNYTKVDNEIESAILPAWINISTTSSEVNPKKINFAESFSSFKKYADDDPTVEMRGQDFCSLDYFFSFMKPAVSEYDNYNWITGWENIAADQITSMNYTFEASFIDMTLKTIIDNNLWIDFTGINQDKLAHCNVMLMLCAINKVIVPGNFAPELKSYYDPNLTSLDGCASPFTGNCSKIINFESTSDENGDVVKYGSNITDVSYMFACVYPGILPSRLTSIGTEGLDLSSAINISYMFLQCDKLLSIDFSTVNFPTVANSVWMFSGCSSLSHIYINQEFSFTQDAVTFEMFAGCTKLVGGNGTKYNGEKIDSTMAKIDKAGNTEDDTDQPGYLTYKGEDACKLTYDLNGGTAEGDAYTGYFQQVKQGDWFTVQGADSLPTPVLSGTGSIKYFAGWKLNELFNDTVYSKGDKLQATSGIIELVAQWSDTPPLKEKLYEYTPEELRDISDYLASLPEAERETDEVYKKFAAFRDGGLTDEGTDNGVPMNADFSNHWAMDATGKLFGETGFVNDATTIQARIIGICEDKDADDKPIGLTMMTTHALSTTSPYESNISYAIYGWAGPTVDGKCTLQSFLNSSSTDASIFPGRLVSVVKPAVKGYQYSSSSGQSIDYNSVANKFWAPSMFELYGSCEGECEEWWSNDHEGLQQYSAFSTKQIKYSDYGPFDNIDKYQSGEACKSFVWSRSLGSGDATNACGIYGDDGGYPINSFYVPEEGGVCACFCFGSEPEPEPTAKAVYTSNDKKLTFYYDNETHEGTTFDIPAAGDLPDWLNRIRATASVEFTSGFYNYKGLTDLTGWFYDLQNLSSIVGLQYLDTSEVSSLCATFSITSLTEIDLSGNNLQSLSNAADCGLYETFQCCRSLTKVTLPANINADVNLYETFDGDVGLAEVDTSNLNFATNSEGLFSTCSSLSKITTANQWEHPLSYLLDEEGTYSSWMLFSGGREPSNYIYGNTKGEVYIKVNSNSSELKTQAKSADKTQKAATSTKTESSDMSDLSKMLDSLDMADTAKTALDVLFSPVEMLSPFAVLRPLIEIINMPINAVMDLAAVILDLA